MVHLLLPRNAFEVWFLEAVVVKKASKNAVWWLEHGAGDPASSSRFCPAHIWDKLLATAVAWLTLLSGRFFSLTHPLGEVCQVFCNLWLEITRLITDRWRFKWDASNNFCWLWCKRWLQFTAVRRTIYWEIHWADLRIEGNTILFSLPVLLSFGSFV